MNNFYNIIYINIKSVATNVAKILKHIIYTKIKRGIFFFTHEHK